MCRIAGIIDKATSSDALEATVKKMCDILEHGGPDDEGIYCCNENHLVLGNRRLSLIDLTEAGHQPMSYANGNYHITYNGELYNYPELKKELQKQGYTFKTHSDTEVILAAFAAWNTEAFVRFNGMFAFALWDAKNTSLYLVRDPSGIKPLYYQVKNGFLAFASELKAFKPIKNEQLKNPNWEVFLMAYGHLPEPVTTLKNVKPLQKGAYLKYNTHSGKCNIKTYTHYSYIERINDRKEILHLIETCLQKAVKRHLISDAPIGVFLSGGLDSSIIALLANQQIKTNLNTISIIFEENKYSEKKYQDLVHQNLNCNHHQHLLKETEFHTYFSDILNTMDLPSCDGINTWFISKYAKQSGLKAVLSGIGGDELFGGYPSFERIKTVCHLQKLPNKLLQTGRFTTNKTIKRLSYLTLDGAKGKYLFLRGQFVPWEIAKHLNAKEEEVWKILEDEPLLDDISYLTPQNQASWMEMNLYMQNQLLRDADVMSMAHGVEIRVPFLDKEIINLALQIESDIKYEGHFKKQLLIDAFKNILPEPVWNRPKMGFAFPFKQWMTNSEFVKSKMDSKKNKQNYQNFISDGMHWSQLMTLLLIENHNYEN